MRSPTSPNLSSYLLLRVTMLLSRHCLKLCHVSFFVCSSDVTTRFADALSKLYDISVRAHTGDTTDRHVHGTRKRDGNGWYVTLSSCVVMVTYSPLVDLEQGRIMGLAKGWRKHEEMRETRETLEEDGEQKKIRIKERGRGEHLVAVVRRSFSESAP